jgi:hypothetical protein
MNSTLYGFYMDNFLHTIFLRPGDILSNEYFLFNKKLYYSIVICNI